MLGLVFVHGSAGAASAVVQAPPVTMSVAAFGALQEAAPFTADQMIARRQAAGVDPDGIAADAALNDWKLCVLDAVARWAELKEGAGTLADGAFGRCADLKGQYRSHLLRITQDGRVVMDIKMARTMTAGLEEIWRPRLIAAALDQELAARALERQRVELPERERKEPRGEGRKPS